MTPRSGLGRPERLQLLVHIADEPNSAVFYLDHQIMYLYSSGAPAYFVYGEPDNPDQPPAIRIGDIEVLGYYQNQNSIVENGLEEAMRAMTIVGGTGSSTVGRFEDEIIMEAILTMVVIDRKRGVIASLSVTLTRERCTESGF